ncbi:MAG: hypothetical protein HGA45_08625 [Chloroflexales bacterium]|nr:hypothetical protein [Chloroflexales bacterium]
MSDMPEQGHPPPITDLRELSRTSYKFLGFSKLSVQLGVGDQQLYGKWCGRCDGIWFGLMLEVQCPRCGNRKG